MSLFPSPPCWSREGKVVNVGASDPNPLPQRSPLPKGKASASWDPGQLTEILPREMGQQALCRREGTPNEKFHCARLCGRCLDTSQLSWPKLCPACQPQYKKVQCSRYLQIITLLWFWRLNPERNSEYHSKLTSVPYSHQRLIWRILPYSLTSRPSYFLTLT